MKTSIIKGAPRKNGETAQVIGALTERLEHEYKVLDAYFTNVSPCIDCRFCRKHSSCAIKDDMEKIYKDIEECDNLILASPIYFSTLTPPMLSVLSRVQTYFSARFFRKETPNIKGKKCGIILIGGGSGGAENALATGKHILLDINCKELLEPIIFVGTDKNKAIEDLDVKIKICQYADRLNEK